MNLLFFLLFGSYSRLQMNTLLGNLTSEKKHFWTAVTIAQAGCLSLKFAKNVRA